MKKNGNRRDFLKKVWAVPAVIAIGTLTHPVSVEAAQPEDKGGKPTSHPGKGTEKGNASGSKLPTNW